MKISKLIKALKKAEKKGGDMPVVICNKLSEGMMGIIKGDIKVVKVKEHCDTYFRSSAIEYEYNNRIYHKAFVEPYQTEIKNKSDINVVVLTEES